MWANQRLTGCSVGFISIGVDVEVFWIKWNYSHVSQVHKYTIISFSRKMFEITALKFHQIRLICSFDLPKTQFTLNFVRTLSLFVCVSVFQSFECVDNHTNNNQTCKQMTQCYWVVGTVLRWFTEYVNNTPKQKVALLCFVSSSFFSSLSLSFFRLVLYTVSIGFQSK